MHKSFVHMKGTKLYNHQGNPFVLEGVGLNAWLLPEGYMFNSYGEIDRPRRFYDWSKKRLGKKESDNFWKCFRETFIDEKDIINIKSLGFNSVRLPFDYEILFYPHERNHILKVKEEGFQLLDRLIQWCNRHEIYIILDLHAAPGGQTGANIDNSKNNQPELFINDIYQKQTIYVWKYIAERYKNEQIIAAYDLLNEPLPNWFSKYYHQVMPLYKDIIEAIRTVDQNHLITIEGVHWATDFSIFKEPLGQGVFLQFHKYWSNFNLQSLFTYIEYAVKHDVALFMGEGGEHYLLWYSGAFKMYRQLGISWNFWSYKKMTNTNSICSFHEPILWQNSLTEDNLFTGDEEMLMFNELLSNIQFDSCKINQDVVNHLFQKDTFQTLGIAFDIDVSKMDIKNHEYIQIDQKAVDNFVCADKEGNQIIPNFSLKTKLGIDTPFPYLKMKPNETYNYTFYATQTQKMKIVIRHLKLLKCEMLIDNFEIIQNSNENDIIICYEEVKVGKHVLSIKSYEHAYLESIYFIV
jgi:endoglucanase